MFTNFVVVWGTDFFVQADDANHKVFCIMRTRGTLIRVTETESDSIPTDLTQWETFGNLAPS